MENGVLFKKEEDGRTRMVIPTGMREDIMRAVHEDVKTGGHFTTRKAMMKVRDEVVVARGIQRPGALGVDLPGMSSESAHEGPTEDEG